MDRETTTISKWYSGQQILVLGGTGFMGKILVEKLLRCCPDLGRIFLLIRKKYGKSPQERLLEYLKSPVFESVNPKQFQKLTVIQGDVLEENLSLSPSDLKILQENTTVIFNMAACVNFDQHLQEAVRINLKGTQIIMDLVTTFKKLQVFVHVSTAYCHCDENGVEERLYGTPHDPRKIIECIGWMDRKLVDSIAPGLVQDHPNTYSYTKKLSEGLVGEYIEKFPIAIVRPSIVIPVWKEPIPGWVDNLNGPTGLSLGAAKGVIRIMHCNASYYSDVIPVDVCMNGIIVTAWKRAIIPKTNEPLVVNLTLDKSNPITWGEALEIGRKHFYRIPPSVMLWYPAGNITSSYYFYVIAAFFLHTLPAYFIDLLLPLFGHKPFMHKVSKKISTGSKLLSYYTTNQWDFHHEKIKQIEATLTRKDREIFYTNIANLDWNSYIKDYVYGIRKFLIHEDPSTIPRARKILQRMYILDLATKLLFGGLLLWFLYSKIFL